MSDPLSKEAIESYRAWLEDELTHSGRAEEDELYETGLALIDRVAQLERVATAAREHVSWDWLHLLDDTVHSRDVHADYSRLAGALRALDGGGDG